MQNAGFGERVKIQQIIENQLPEFILGENPKFVEFLKQYYISQEYQGGPVDIADNLDRYLKLDNLTPEVIRGNTHLTESITSTSETINVVSTKGFPPKYGLIRIDNEIITYTESTETTFEGCIRGFSGVTDYHAELNQEELVFESTSAADHANESIIYNLSSLFLQEFYKKLKFSLTPGLENLDFAENLNVANFVKEARGFYESKGTDESFRILFNVLYNESPTIINLEDFLLKPSDASYIRRSVVIVRPLSGSINDLEGQTIYKSTDNVTTASVSEIESFTRKGVTYYKLNLFVGYDDTNPTITGTFDVTQNTRVVDDVTISGTEPIHTISVDSTVGFDHNGLIYSNHKPIYYTEKTLNQFLGCYTNESEPILIDKTDYVHGSNTYYGYADGDENQKVEFLITGVLSNAVIDNEKFNFKSGDVISPKSLGTTVSKDGSKLSIFTNAWLYNTSTRYQIDTFSGSTITTKVSIDRNTLKAGDKVEILSRNTEIVPVGFDDITILSIAEDGTITLNVSTTPLAIPGTSYDVRRLLKKATSSTADIQYGNNVVSSDVQNVYIDKEDVVYVASNSLPGYEITSPIFEYEISSLDEFDNVSQGYSVIRFNDVVSFLTGDKVKYIPNESDPIEGLNEEFYFVDVLSDKTSIKLYQNGVTIPSTDFLKFGTSDTISSGNNIILFEQRTKTINPQKILKKIDLKQEVEDNVSSSILPGALGMLKNGAEIFTFKTNDKVYYGPLESINILNGGKDYDVINPPLLEIPGTADISPVIIGSVKSVYVDPQDFDFEKIISIDLTGGNGSGAKFEPVVEKFARQIDFDAREFNLGGGLDIVNERITFTKPHGLIDGQEITYNKVNNLAIGIEPFQGPNTDSGESLIDGAIYYPEIINDQTIRIYRNYSDFFAGINTVGFSTIGASGIHKFKLETKNRLSEIRVTAGGEGFAYRNLKVNTSGISTTNHFIEFENHGFSEGEIIEYTPDGTPISGVSSTTKYKVLFIDENRFRISDAGVDGIDNTNYDRHKYVKFNNAGTGRHHFSYPEINMVVNFSSPGAGNTSIIATPVIRGSIDQIYIFDKGEDYGTTTLNVHSRPKISVLNGKEAQFSAVVENGQISRIRILYGGLDYYSTPDLVVESPTGIGAVLRPVIKGGTIIDVIIVTGGLNYANGTTAVYPVSAGSGAIFQANVRPLTVNSSIKFGVQNQFYRDPASEIITTGSNGLQYAVVSYSQNIKNQLGDNGDLEGKHSDIIGWAYYGNPIYGSFGYSNPDDINSTVRRLTPSYEITNVENRPSTSIFPRGYFVEDYKYTATNDLDQYNGRFGKTKDFPDGVYAYFATTELNADGQTVGKFPYFVGHNYKSEYIQENDNLDQSFDLNSTNVLRNTLPYGVSNQFADNDFLIESNEVIKQETLIESVSAGGVNGYEVIKAGTDYSIGDRVTFELESGTSPFIKVSEIQGKDIETIRTDITSYDDTIITWKNGSKIIFTIYPYHDFNNGDNINIIGVSTDKIDIQGSYEVGVTTVTSLLSSQLNEFNMTGFATDVFVNYVPENVSVGNTVTIDDEFFQIIGVNSKQNILTLRRDNLGVAHTFGTQVRYLPYQFEINKEMEAFTSNIPKRVNFNPQKSVGVGIVTGTGVTLDYTVGLTTYQTFVETKSIFLQNHPFKTGDKVTIKKPTASDAIPIRVPNLGTVDVPDIIDELFVIRKTSDFIGLVTTVGLTSESQGVFFENNGSDNFDYIIETIEDNITATSERINAVVSVSTSHNLERGDEISLEVKPNINVGIGTTNKILVKYLNNNLIVNPISFSTTEVNSQKNTITVEEHSYVTGQKVFYDSGDDIISGLSTGEYFVYKVDENTIRLAETYVDATSVPPLLVGFGNTGGDLQFVAAVNPPIANYKNNNLIFDVSDDSLQGYDFKFFYDNSFKNEFDSFTSDGTFVVTGVGGSVGFSSIARVNLNFSETTPEVLYYNLAQDGIPINTTDNDVSHHSEILFKDSLYNSDHKVMGTATTEFSVALRQLPESLVYLKEDCDVIKYTTKSQTATGGIESINIVSQGYGMKSLPVFSGVESINGAGAFIVPVSDSIGNIISDKLRNEGYEYPSDNTVRPSAIIPQEVFLADSNTIDTIEIIFGGQDYASAPDVVLIDTDTREIIDSGYIRAKVNGASITDLDIEFPANGLPIKPVTMKTINNSNGINIDKVEYSQSGIVTCTITTPIFGFTQQPLEQGQEIFVEGIEKVSGSTGDGINSTDLGFNFFRITQYYATNPVKFEYDVSDYTNNGGNIKFIQEGYATVINKDNYPEFKVNQKGSQFLIDESLSVISDAQITSDDLRVISADSNIIRVLGSRILKVGERISGNSSNSAGTIDFIRNSTGSYNTSWTNLKEFDWKYNIGKLNENAQVLPDNDYYQNLSYTIKSSKSWEEIVGNVNSLVHTSGMKNFADMQFTESTQSGISTESPESVITVTNSYISDLRVDRINYFDNAIDINISGNVSRFLKFKNTYLLDFILCKTNNVIAIDDISSEFSSRNDVKSDTQNLSFLNSANNYNKFYIQSRDLITNQIQFSEIITLNTNNQIYTLFKSDLSNFDYNIADIEPVFSANFEYFLGVTANDPDNAAIVFKTLNETVSGVSLTSGNVDLNMIQIEAISCNASVGVNTTLFSLPADDFDAAHVSVHIKNADNSKMNYIELYVTHDNVDTYMNEFFFDSDGEQSFDILGEFTADIVDGNFILEYENTINEGLVARSRTIGFGTVTEGDGDYRFKLDDQPIGSERSLMYQTFNTVVAAGTTAIFELEASEFAAVKSVVSVGQGENSAVHQITTICDGEDAYIMQNPFLSVGPKSGIGTFGANYDSNTGEFSLIFTPDSYFDVTRVKALNTQFYKDFDFINPTPDLEYDPFVEDVKLSSYYGVNVDLGINFDFAAKVDGVDIFAKTFNPNSSAVNYTTNEFNLNSHFFQPYEELIYTPQSSFIGVGTEPIEIEELEVSAGVLTTHLPTQVFAIKIDQNTFKLATTRENAIAGIAITLTSPGVGNAHILEMKKKNEKALITVSNVVQAPIAFTYIQHDLAGNGGNISIGQTFFALSGISSVKPSDVLLIEDEYVRVENVGLSNNTTGPITFSGNVPLVEVSRGVLGTDPAEHLDGTRCDLYRGSFNIVKNNIHFTEPPRGNQLDLLGPDESKLPRERATFSGRVFLRQDYDSNQVYDDISEQFTGVGQTFTLTRSGLNTVGLGTSGGSGLVFINGIFQAPTTENNSSNNYIIEEDLNLGISSITFSGVEVDDEIFITDNDVNQNQLPRGGLIVSYGSTPGLGYAPLEGARVTPVLNSSGSIIDLNVLDHGSGYREPVAIAVTDLSYEHRFVRSDTNAVSATTGGPFTPSGADYDSLTGVLVLTIADHGLAGTDTILIADNSIYFTCARDNFASEHSYPRPTDPASGVNLPITSFTNNTITVNVGPGGGTGTDGVISAVVGVGGTLIFTIDNSGTGYIDPVVDIEDPVYENMEIIGVSRLGEGATTDTGVGLLVNVEIGAAKTSVGIGSTLFEVSNFQITRTGYGFKRGDIFTVDGLVTDRHLTEPVEQFQISVLDTFTDSFSATQFGELDYIDSIAPYQDGERVRFPLIYKGENLSFQTDELDPESSSIDLNNVLVIFNNGILQEPGSSYFFDGGSTFIFAVAPRALDDVQIFFYRGTRGIDSTQFEVDETIKVGDIVQVMASNQNDDTIAQEKRRVYTIDSADVIQTDAYPFQGIDPVNYKPVHWTKQKEDLIINNERVSKARDSIAAQVYPTSNVIASIESTSTTFWLDSGELWNYEDDAVLTTDALLYTNREAVGMGTTMASLNYETVVNINDIDSFVAQVVGITTVPGVGGADLAIQFTIERDPFTFPGFAVGDYFYISKTSVGSGNVSIEDNDTEIVATSTAFCDNIYKVAEWTELTGVIKANVRSDSPVVGLTSTGTLLYPCGTLSFARLSGAERRPNNPLSIDISNYTSSNSGLSTYPILQRRDAGLRDTGALEL